MDSNVFIIACTIFITCVNVISAAFTLYTLMKKPAKHFKEKQEAELETTIRSILNKVLPEILKKHDEETRVRYQGDTNRVINEIEKKVRTDITDDLYQIKVLTASLETLSISAKDVLREKIVAIYQDNKDQKKLPILARERLEQFYKDYKELKGNSYIDKYYNRMKHWEVIDDDEDDDEII